MKFILLFTMMSFFNISSIDATPATEVDEINIESCEDVAAYIRICFKINGKRQCIRVKVGGGKKKKKILEDGMGDNLLGEYMEAQGMLKISGFPPEINGTQLDVLAGEEITGKLETKGGRTIVQNGSAYLKYKLTN